MCKIMYYMHDARADICDIYFVLFSNTKLCVELLNLNTYILFSLAITSVMSNVLRASDETVVR